MTAEQRVLPGHEERVDLLMAGLTEDIRHNEPGCLRFDYVVDAADPLRRMVFETYRDEAALELHASTAYLAAFIPQLLECLAEPPALQRYSEALPKLEQPTFFHTGIVVPDLDKAVAYYSDHFGMSFTEPGTFVIPRLEDPDPHPFELTAVLSRTEAPFLELIQARGEGIVGPDKCGKILYHAYFETDMAGRYEWLRQEGPGVDAAFRMDAHTAPFSMITAADPFGNRIEYIGIESRDPLTEWVRTGVLPGGIGS